MHNEDVMSVCAFYLKNNSCWYVFGIKFTYSKDLWSRHLYIYNFTHIHTHTHMCN